jgi:hypothetical protein
MNLVTSDFKLFLSFNSDTSYTEQVYNLRHCRAFLLPNDCGERMNYVSFRPLECLVASGLGATCTSGRINKMMLLN